MELIQLAILGIGAGTGYALIAHGVVLIYRGSGTLNFAHGAVAMVAAELFFVLRDEQGWNSVVSFVGALSVSALIGVAMQVLVLRPLRRSSALVRLVATLALLTLLMGLGVMLWGGKTANVKGVLPSRPLHLGDSLIIPSDRLYLFGIALVLTFVLTQVYRRTRFGLATAGASENERAATLLGWSPSVLGGVNWAVGCVLAGTAGVLMASIVGLSVRGLTMMIVPGLAAALIARFSSFWLALAGGLAIGVAQSIAGRYVSEAGFTDAIPFLAITALVVLRGQALPLRGEVNDRPARVGTGHTSWKLLVVPIVVAFVAVGTLSSDWILALTTSLLLAVVALSFVVLTGYAGQISLAQLTIAGIGAWVAGVASYYWSFPMPLAVLVAVVVTAAAGAVIGLPALRTRGMNLAVLTLGMSVMIEGVVLSNKRWQGGLSGLTVDSPSLFGLDLGYIDHPQRYTALVLVVFIVAAVLVANIRRSQSGRRLLAIRSNERAAASLGINVTGGKLFAFSFGAGLAGLGGALAAFQFRQVTLTGYSTLGSITMLLNTVVGGMGFVFGAIQGGLAGHSGLFGFLLSKVSGNSTELLVVLAGALVLAVILIHPDGFASRFSDIVAGMRQRHRVAAAVAVDDLLATAPAVEDRSGDGLPLVATGISVTYGGVRAVSDVSLEVHPGEVLGIIGPNGAGKTTVIDALCGFTRSSGEILLGSSPLHSRSASTRARLGLARTFQAVEMFDDMSLLENIQVAAGCRSGSAGGLAYVRDMVLPRRRQLPGVAVAAIRELDLAGDLADVPSDLPAGRQRLAGIARALSTDPKVICLDEPAAGLSDVEATELAHLVRAIAERWHLSVIVIEHNVEFVRTVSDRVMALDLGQVIASGTPDEVLASPAVVAAYTGSRPEPLMTTTQGEAP